MIEATISVIPVQAGWAVEADGGELTVFLRGGRAEAHAQRLGLASWSAGVPAMVLVHDRDGNLVGAWRFGPNGDGELNA